MIDGLSNDILRAVANDHIRALEEAKKGIEQEEPEKINDIDYL